MSLIRGAARMWSVGSTGITQESARAARGAARMGSVPGGTLGVGSMGIPGSAPARSAARAYPNSVGPMGIIPNGSPSASRVKGRWRTPDGKFASRPPSVTRPIQAGTGPTGTSQRRAAIPRRPPSSSSAPGPKGSQAASWVRKHKVGVAAGAAGGIGFYAGSQRTGSGYNSQPGMYRY